jgi:hypothetical protein
MALGKPVSPDAIDLGAETLKEFVHGLVESAAGASEQELDAARSAIAFLRKASARVQLVGETEDLLGHVERDLTSLS